MKTNKANNYPAIGLRGIMPFGKYAGKRIYEIKEIQPSYIDWLWSEKIVHLKKEVLFVKADEAKSAWGDDEFFDPSLIGALKD
jgi:hypothetical protein